MIWDMKEEGENPRDRIIGVSHNQRGTFPFPNDGRGRDAGGSEQQGPLRVIRACWVDSIPPVRVDNVGLT